MVVHFGSNFEVITIIFSALQCDYDFNLSLYLNDATIYQQVNYFIETNSNAVADLLYCFLGYF